MAVLYHQWRGGTLSGTTLSLGHLVYMSYAWPVRHTSHYLYFAHTHGCCTYCCSQ